MSDDRDALEAVATRLLQISREAGEAEPPEASMVSDDFRSGYRSGRFLAAEAALDVLTDETEVMDVEEIDALLEGDDD